MEHRLGKPWQPLTMQRGRHGSGSAVAPPRPLHGGHFGAGLPKLVGWCCQEEHREVSQCGELELARVLQADTAAAGALETAWL